MKLNQLVLAAVAALPSAVSGASIYEIAANATDFSTLAAAVEAAGLADTLSGDGTFTVFAPNNDAFAKVSAEVVTKLLDPIWLPQLQDVLLYHALGSVVLSTDLTDGLTTATLNGEDITINLDPARVNDESNIIAADITADNGVIHGIDTVLAPTSLTSNIVDLAVATDDLSTLVAAVTAAGLGDALSGDGPLTVFAPTNEAFAALPEGTVESLLLPENIDQLTDILTYHVVAANAASSGLSSGSVETLNGDSVEVTVSDGGVMVNDATVTTADIIASNGIIHIIDKVLMPPTDTPATESPVPAPTKSPTSGANGTMMVEGTMLSLFGSLAVFFLSGF